jgi:predicted esterase YcpF (UPF0227 family)
MIIYLHGFDATSPGNHEKVLQLQFIDDDVRFVHYSTVHPRHDMSHLLKEVKKQLDMSTDPKPLICGVAGRLLERADRVSVRHQAGGLQPQPAPGREHAGQDRQAGRVRGHRHQCVTEFRNKNSGNCLCILSVQDEIRDNRDTERELKNYYDIVWDERETHKFKNISHHLQRMKAFKEA